MEQALKQRLVGALVITALAAIFVPMFFEDSVDDTRREVDSSDLAIPAPPEQLQSEDNPIPRSPQQVLHTPQEEAPAAGEEQPVENAAAPDQQTEAQPATAEVSAQPAQAAPLANAAAPPAEEPQPAPAAAKPKAETGAQPQQPKPAPVKKPKPQGIAAQAVAPPAPKQATAVPSLQRWVVQLGSFTKKDNADALVNKLRAQGLNAYGDSIQVAGKGTMYRVRVGPELDKKRAQAAQKKLQQQTGSSGILLSE